MENHIVKNLTNVLSQISREKWESIVKQEPEWLFMESFSNRFGFGPFAVLMVAIGLNDFQLKGKAEIAYWPKIHLILEKSSSLKSRTELLDLLKPFYLNERLNKRKVERFEKFINSSLANELWHSTAKEVSVNFLNIWQKLSIVMNQKPQAKTVSFAMKCLGLALLMSKENSFNFSSIPIPVDSRIEKLTKHLGFEFEDHDAIRSIWNGVLFELQKNNSNLNMIHLDSFLWQIASLNLDELKSYFADLELDHIYDQLASLLK